jgi:hypothetical protein
MKKIYITPSIKVMDIETEVLLTGSNYDDLESDGLNVFDGESVTPESAMSKERNSIWN